MKKAKKHGKNLLLFSFFYYLCRRNMHIYKQAG